MHSSGGKSMKRILFVCKHNVFRSRIAEFYFKKFNKNKDYSASSAGILKWNKRDIKGDKAYEAEKKAAKRFGIDLSVKSRGIDSSTLKDTDILVIVADDVPAKLFKKEKSFRGKVLVWKVKDVTIRDKNKRKVAENSIKVINKKISEFVNFPIKLEIIAFLTPVS